MAVTAAPVIWQATILVGADDVPAFAAVFDDIAASLNVQVPDEDDPETRDNPWQIQAHFTGKPNVPAIEMRLDLVAAARGGAAPLLSVAPIADIDWVRHVEESLPPVFQSGFCLHGAHHDIKPSQAPYRLQIDAGRAFGTGHHETTRGVLSALAWLAKRRHFARLGLGTPRILDLGTGTGVLAFASILLWRTPVLGSDIDKTSVATAKGLARLNGLEPWFRAVVAVGCRHSRIQRAPAFTLVTANILARPLMAMAGDIHRCMEPGGVVILSGLLHHQKQNVLNLYRSYGFGLLACFRLGHWPTLVLYRQRK